MRSCTDPAIASPAASPSRRCDALSRCNRRLHNYLGLYLLLFVWLFAFTGLLLNHSQWKFARFWESRRETSYERDIAMPLPDGDLAQARALMRQLELRGEIEWTTARNDGSRLDFRVNRPGRILDVKADLVQKKASIRSIHLNAWGVMRILHTFTGVRIQDERNKRDWALTKIWAFAMDAVAAGLVLMVVSSLLIWFQSRQKRLLGTLVLLLGFLSCSFFCLGLRWLY